MTIGTFHAYYTLILFIIMVGIIVWAYTKANRNTFDEAANLIFADDDEPNPSNTPSHHSASKPSLTNHSGSCAK